jgi:hypothetical protein
MNLKYSAMIRTVLKITLTIIMTTQTAFTQNNSKTQKYPLKEDVSSIDRIMKATYETVSGEAGA